MKISAREIERRVGPPVGKVLARAHSIPLPRVHLRQLIGVGLRNRLGLIGGGSVAQKARPFFTAAGEAPVPDAEKTVLPPKDEVLPSHGIQLYRHPRVSRSRKRTWNCSCKIKERHSRERRPFAFSCSLPRAR